jgi:tRNA uridine 5-carboxymethylaminomethyl modification enzyme
MFANEWRLMLEQTPNVDFWQDTVMSVIVENGKICGVRTSLGLEIKSKSVVLTNGTFLNGLIHVGDKNFGGGRAGERNSKGITEQLIELGFDHGRMKTGTPPRVDARSLDFTKMEEQPGDKIPGKFSFSNTEKLKKQRSCHITYTNPDVHDILRSGLDRSPMFSGSIEGTGPRYCPSIEEKIERFSERDRHQIFVEPEGWDTVEIYVNGFSTSLPMDVQIAAIKKIPGFENVKLFRPGYAIEYDYFPPTQLKHTLETKLVDGLYFAGQINGTTGYEEAGGQGLMAGLNASLKSQEKEPVILRRDQAYIGVLIDDLITKGTKEPYRMFTSRAEYRILLRQDNADIRLTPLSHSIGLASEERLRNVEKKSKETEDILKRLGDSSISPEVANPYLEASGTSPISQKVKLSSILSRPQVNIDDLTKDNFKEFELNKYSKECLEQAEIKIKYDGYIKREREMADKLNRLEDVIIIDNFDFHALSSLSSEAREKLSSIKPKTIGQASRISGVSPSDISVLLIHFGR